MLGTNVCRSLGFILAFHAYFFTWSLLPHVLIEGLVTRTCMYIVHCEAVYLLHLVNVSSDGKANALPFGNKIKSTFIDLSSYNPEEYMIRCKGGFCV